MEATARHTVVTPNPLRTYSEPTPNPRSRYKLAIIIKREGHRSIITTAWTGTLLPWRTRGHGKVHIAGCLYSMNANCRGRWWCCHCGYSEAHWRAPEEGGVCSCSRVSQDPTLLSCSPPTWAFRIGSGLRNHEEDGRAFWYWRLIIENWKVHSFHPPD